MRRSTRAALSLIAGGALVVSGLATALPSAATSTTAADLPALLAVAAESTSPAYSRDRFEHWIDADGDGCNTRFEVLIEESTTPVEFGAGCSIVSGTWVSALDGFVASVPADIEIDHLVALAEAWRSGASAWTDAQRRDFANDLGVSYALNVSSTTANQSKADRDPARWMPTNTAYHCEYVTSWALTKYRWSLSVDPAELSALEGILTGECGETPVELPVVMTVGGAEPEPEPQTVVTPFQVGDTRLSGPDRYATALEVSDRFAPGVPAVFVATGTNFPDALSAASVAALVGGPLLLTPTASLPSAVHAEIRRLEPAVIYVIGGAGAVSNAVENSLVSIAPVKRLRGTDRYSTGIEIVKETFTSASTVFIATGRSFPDALAATGAAGARQAPVVLVDGAQPSLDSATLQLLDGLDPENVAIVGAKGAVSTGIENQLRQVGAVARYGGPDRYTTASFINNAFFPPGSTDTRFLATGTNFPDALAGAALAGRLGAPLFVTSTACVPAPVRDAVATLGASKNIIMGGAGAVSAAAAANQGCLVSALPRITGTAKVGSTLTASAGAWSPGTSFTYQWLANGAAVGGGSTLALTAAHAGKSITVRVTGSLAGYVGTSRISSGVYVGYPDRTPPVSTMNCPSWAPIKGNANSGIYHVPGGRYYDATRPEECFRTEAAAVAAGYRKSKL